MSVITFPPFASTNHGSAAPDPTGPGPAVTDVTRLGTVLGVWAHPDDEAFLSGGLMAAARDAGQLVVDRDARRARHHRPWPPDRLARVRRHELDASLAVLGVDEHHLLGITDGTCRSPAPGPRTHG